MVHDGLAQERGVLSSALPRGVGLHCFYGTQVETSASATFARGTFDDPAPRVGITDGDGVVPHESLSLCRSWLDANASQGTVRVLEFPNVGHGELLRVAQGVEAIVQAVLSYTGALVGETQQRAALC